LTLLMPFIRAIAPYMSTMFRTWMKMGADIANAIVPFLTGTVIPFIMKMLPLIQPLLDLLLQGGFVAVIAAVMGIYGALVALSAIVQGLSWIWDNVFKPIFTFIGEKLKAVWDALVPVFAWLGNVLAPVIEVIKNVLGWLWDTVKWVANYVSGVLKGVFDVISGVLGWIWGILQPLWNVVNTVFRPVWESISKVLNDTWKILENVWNWFKGTMEGVFNAIKKAVEGFAGLFGWVPKFAEGGFMKEGGLAMLHSNEWILNESQMKNLLSGSLANNQNNSEQQIAINVGGITINGGVGGLTVSQIRDAVNDGIADGVRRRRRR